MKYGDCPINNCDEYGARDVWVFEFNNTYYMHYDAAGPTAWLSSQAKSTDLYNWTKTGPILQLGQPGTPDSASASYAVTYFDGNIWHMWYLGTPNATPPPYRIPSFPYNTLYGIGESSNGPWIKNYSVTPWDLKGYYSVAGSPGFTIINPQNSTEYLQFFSAQTMSNDIINRTISIARTINLSGKWTIDAEPMLPLSEQIENSSLYFEETNQWWFLFTNHVGINSAYEEYDDAIWVYWTKDPNTWNATQKAIVLDGYNSIWTFARVGLPSVLKVNNILYIYYDGPGGNSINNNYCNVALATLDLPLVPPV